MEKALRESKARGYILMGLFSWGWYSYVYSFFMAFGFGFGFDLEDLHYLVGKGGGKEGH